MSEAHVVPLNDLIEHTSDDECACGPEARPMPQADGSMKWLMIHHSLDGRELRGV